MIDFLLNLPMFKGLSRMKVLAYSLDLTKVKYNLGKVVYAQYDPINYVYIVYKGQFELSKHLPSQDKRKSKILQMKKGEERVKVENVLT